MGADARSSMPFIPPRERFTHAKGIAIDEESWCLATAGDERFLVRL